MLVKEVMSPRVRIVAHDATLEEAGGRMAAEDVGCLAVRDGGTMVGLVTDRDIVTRGVGKGLAPTVAVADVMTPSVTFVRPDTPVAEAARAMEAAHIRRLLVIDEHDRLCGIVSLGDLAGSIDDGEVDARVLRTVHPAP